jgi:hypothetical protein
MLCGYVIEHKCDMVLYEVHEGIARGHNAGKATAKKHCDLTFANISRSLQEEMNYHLSQSPH